ncbi:MAG TPA: hypothetical protein VFF66_07855 [Brevundimonas sp.]|nr:hypothetical protein [Brevundimonas sp.]
MKRAILSKAAAVIAVAASACSPAPPEQVKTQAGPAAAWARPPVIEVVERTASSLVVSGVAEPEARVVLRSDEGAAFAATADSRGRFEVRLPAPTGHLLLRPETQVGQDAAPSPGRLLILAAARGPIVMLRPGGPTRRLDAAPALGAVDSDGRMRLASGRVPPGTAAVEVQSGGETVQVTPDAQGRWSVMLAPHEGPDQIRVDGRDFVWPGQAAPSADVTVERAETGWRIGWAGPGDARQSTWLPDRSSL